MIKKIINVLACVGFILLFIVILNLLGDLLMK